MWSVAQIDHIDPNERVLIAYYNGEIVMEYITPLLEDWYHPEDWLTYIVQMEVTAVLDKIWFDQLAA
jgi:hypothetical protein